MRQSSHASEFSLIDPKKQPNNLIFYFSSFREKTMEKNTLTNVVKMAGMLMRKGQIKGNAKKKVTIINAEK